MIPLLTLKAPAKINLGLTIIRRRVDGYHDLESVMQQVSLSDTLRFEAGQFRGWRFLCSNPELAGEDNLVCRAAELMAGKTGKPLPGVMITLFKNIPVEAGLAGGSSDAAAALIGLNHCWQLGYSMGDLLELALLLGSDVPYCLQGGTVVARGRGEQLEQLPPLPFFWVVLALPEGVKVSTATAYSSFDQNLLGEPSLQLLINAIQAGSRKEITDWLGSGLTNTLETAVLPGSDQVAGLKSKLQAAGFQPVLSGSGPTLLILTEDYSRARSAVRAAEEAGARAYLCWTKPGGKEWLNV
ncbi:MAG: 4-(cytidine 5'-diphospho)-2-C-methyl-D-erythritol kinase [Dethiobacteria bacterium]|nr:4-(cytidine 5'-diphospho)-2-C-methyl-D-erythritol kinase [Dethiobacteria bacterium]